MHPSAIPKGHSFPGIRWNLYFKFCSLSYLQPCHQHIQQIPLLPYFRTEDKIIFWLRCPECWASAGGMQACRSSCWLWMLWSDWQRGANLLVFNGHLIRKSTYKTEERCQLICLLEEHLISLYSSRLLTTANEKMGHLNVPYTGGKSIVLLIFHQSSDFTNKLRYIFLLCLKKFG